MNHASGGPAEQTGDDERNGIFVKKEDSCPGLI